MKKIFTAISLVMALASLSSCDWFVLDNQDGYDASVHGSLVDSKTGTPVQSEHATSTITYSWGTYTWSVDVASGGIFSVYQYDWDTEEAETWNVKNNGTFRNDLTFAGKYRMESKSDNYYPTTQDFELKKGDNEVNFTVTPYARVLNPQVTYSNGRIEATCSIEHGDPSQTTAFYEARLCCYTDRFVGTLHNNTSENTYNADYTMKSCVVSSYPSTNTLSFWIDTDDSKFVNEFKYKRAHYVRIAVCAIGSVSYPYGPWYAVAGGVNSTDKRYNYSPVFRVNEDGTVDEVTDWGDE